MPKEELHREIDALRKQMAEEQSRPRESGDPPTLDESDEQVAEEEIPTQEGFPDFMGLQPHLEELFESMEQELKELPAMTAVALFGLGVIFGRLLSR